MPKLTYTSSGSLLLSLRFVNALIALLSAIPSSAFDEYLSRLCEQQLCAERADKDISNKPCILVVDELFHEVLRDALGKLRREESGRYEKLVSEWPGIEEIVEGRDEGRSGEDGSGGSWGGGRGW